MSRLAALAISLSLVVAACDDPKKPETWIKKLRDPEVATTAVQELRKIGDPKAIGPLCDLYKDFESPTILKAIIDLAKKDPKNKRAIDTLIAALEFTEDKYHNATLAAEALADMGATEAVEPLGKVLARELPIKSRANLAKLAAVKALGQLNDKAAVPHLIKTLERRPEQQDFLLNKQAAVALGNLGDERAVSALIRGLFMASTIQGTSYPQARVALVALGKPAVQPLIAALQRKDEKLEAMAKELEFEDGVLVGKIARELGDLMAPEAVPPLLELLAKAKTGEEYTKGIDGIIEALGRIGDERALPPLLKLLKDGNVNYKLRMQVCQALTVMGPKKAVEPLLEVAEKGKIEGGWMNLREAAIMAYSRIVGADAVTGYDRVKKMLGEDDVKKYDATLSLFKEALERIEVAKECKDDAACYGKKVVDKSLKLVQREKAGIMIGVLPTGRDALDKLVAALPEREPVLRLYFLESAKRIGKAADKALISTIEELSIKDSKRTVKFLGADLAAADKVAVAVIRNKT